MGNYRATRKSRRSGRKIRGRFILLIIVTLLVFVLYTANQSHDGAWQLMLINAEHPLPLGYMPELKTIEGIQMDKRVVPDMNALMDASRRAGLSLIPASGYRSIHRQDTLFNNKVNQYKEQGMEEASAEAFAATLVARPGTSEHNAGLAVDYNCITGAFEDSDEYRWLLEHAPDYGFILRYPKNKQHITGIQFEPWHFRYVGKKNARAIMDSGLTLEEYLEKNPVD